MAGGWWRGIGPCRDLLTLGRVQSHFTAQQAPLVLIRGFQADDIYWCIWPTGVAIDKRHPSSGKGRAGDSPVPGITSPPHYYSQYDCLLFWDAVFKVRPWAGRRTADLSSLLLCSGLRWCMTASHASDQYHMVEWPPLTTCPLVVWWRGGPGKGRCPDP